MKRRLNYLFNVYLNNKNYGRALSVTLEALCEGDPEKAQLVARNTVAVIRALMPKNPETSAPVTSNSSGGGGRHVAGASESDESEEYAREMEDAD